MMEYVTYDGSGALTGAYSQALVAAHANNHIEVTAAERDNWTAYRANSARSGIELKPASPPSPPTAAEMEVTIQSSLDIYAQSWGYNDIASACTYVNDPCAKFHDEATALRAWRSATWQTVEATDAAIRAGTQPYPATMQEALSLLPQPPARPA